MEAAERQLEANCNQHGIMFLVDTPRDGNCFFHAVSDQYAIHTLQISPFPRLPSFISVSDTFFPEKDTHALLRQVTYSGETGVLHVPFAINNGVI
jgi:hypothetical protein